MSIGNRSEKWKLAGNMLQALVAEAAKRPITSISESEDQNRTIIASPLPGFTFEAKTSWLLNDSIIVEFEAEQSYCFGLFYRSIYSIVEFSPDGDVETNPIYSRFESRLARKRRRGWVQS